MAIMLAPILGQFENLISAGSRTLGQAATGDANDAERNLARSQVVNELHRARIEQYLNSAGGKKLRATSTCTKRSADHSQLMSVAAGPESWIK